MVMSGSVITREILASGHGGILFFPDLTPANCNKIHLDSIPRLFANRSEKVR